VDVLLITALACSGDPDPTRPDDTDTDTVSTIPTGHTGDTDTDTDTETIPGGPALVFDGPRPRNVLMLSIDTTRRDYIAPYTPDGAVYTPFLSGKMAEGVRLDQHLQCSNWTYASTSCTLQGQYHEERGYIPDFGPILNAWLPDGQRSFAVRLGEKGYQSVMISSNGWMTGNVNNAQGYDEAPPQTTGNAMSLATNGFDAMQARIAADPRPWLLHVHFVEPHPPYVPPEEYRAEVNALPPLPDELDLDTQPGHYDAAWNEWPNLTPELQDLLEAHLKARYRGELRWFDDQLVSIWDMFEQGGMLDDTLVVVWTDHGEQFWEHGNQTHAWYLGGEENDGVAFFWAKNLRQRVWDQPTHAVDLLPTTLEALGLLDDPEDEALSGHVVGGGMPANRSRFGMTVARRGVLQSVTGANGWKLVFAWTGEVDLYDRNTDPAEAVDLYAPDHPEVLPLWEELLPRVKAFETLLPSRVVTWPAGLPQE
jgi:arylsulfatase A-like enzyme